MYTLNTQCIYYMCIAYFEQTITSVYKLNTQRVYILFCVKIVHNTDLLGYPA